MIEYIQAYFIRFSYILDSVTIQEAKRILLLYIDWIMMIDSTRPWEKNESTHCDGKHRMFHYNYIRYYVMITWMIWKYYIIPNGLPSIWPNYK